MFQKHKRDFLGKRDKSIKSSVDKKIRDIINIINKNENYYTTSSCSGRILLLIPGKRKKETKWIYVSHDRIKIDESNINNIKKMINKNIKNYKKQNKKIDIFLKQESFILHVCCKDIESAKALIKITNKIGVRRSGIVSIDKNNEKIIMEIIGSEHFETMIVKNNNVIVDDDYFKIIINEANNRLNNNNKKLKELHKTLKKEL
jgi:tRNA wybutosine-synthesizing protein 3